jgi:RHS repeat-associated protein
MRSIKILCAAIAALVPATAFALGGPSPGAVTAQTVRLPSGPGSVRGLADAATVTAFTGQVSYQVPLELPAGPGAMTPSLTLGYDGELGNGPLGVGWRLSQAAIRRSLRLGVPHYDATDEIELVGLGSGQVVELASGEIRIEGAGNAYTGRIVDGGYELTDADGRIYRFGTTAAARKASGTKVSWWYLEQVRDVAGNTVDYHYVADKGEVYLDAIAWGPAVGTDRAFRATLAYEARADAVVSYRTGFRVESGKRLRQVQVWSFGAVQRIVTIGYETQFALTRVRTVQITSGDGAEALPTTRFTYAAAQPGVQTAVTGLAGWALNLQGTSLFDVDGDGAMDLLRLTGAGHSWRRNTGGQFAAATAMPGALGAALDQVRLVDLDGDSVAEMLVSQGTQWVVHKLDRASASWVSLGALGGTANVSLAGVAIADLDGDQRMDVLSPFGSQLQVRMGTAAGLTAPVTRGAIDPLRTSIQPGGATTSFYDINGDGLADAIYLASSQLYLYLGKGDGTFEKYKDVAYPWGGTANPSQVRLGDLNRDGLLDIALISAGNVAWYRGRANGTFDTVPVSLPRPAGTDASVVVAIADLNGNGSEDLVWSSDAGMWILDLAGPITAGMLLEIDNGLGQVQQFSYEASTAQMFAAERAGAPWTTTMPISIPVTAGNRVTLLSGEPARSSRLDVRDAIYDPAERRFIGFERSTVTRPDPADGAAPTATVRTVRRYATGLGLDRVLRGQVVNERIEDGTGALFVETDTTVLAATVAGLATDDPRLRRAVVVATEQRHHEGQATPIVTRTEYAHDDEGRTIETRALGRLDRTGDEVITRVQYTAGRSARGVRDRVCDTLVVDAAEVVVSHTQHRFGDDQTIAPPCDASTGWPRQTLAYLASESRWIVTSATAYSATGLAVAVTAGGVTRAIDYDATGMHPIGEQVSPTAGEVLRWEQTWNDALQVPTRTVDADGSAIVSSYDGLGRLVASGRDGREPDGHTRYHPVAPRPWIEGFRYDGPADAVPALPATWRPADHWRHTVTVLDSAGEPLFVATRIDVDRWVVGDRRTRDALGRTVAIADAYEWIGNVDDLVASSVPPGVPTRTTTYDALDRPVVQTLADGTTSQRSYAAFSTTRTSPGLAPVTSYLDGRDRIWRTERTVGGAAEAVEASYDAADRLTAMRLPTAAGVVAHAFRYDTLGQLVLATDPDIGDRTVRYDDAGRVVARTNGAGQQVSYAYDDAGRLTAMTATDGGAFAYHYDHALDPTAFGYTAGRLAWVEEPTGRAEQGYDAAGRLDHTRRTVHGRSGEQITRYAASGLALSIGDEDGFSVDVSYDPAGRPLAAGGLWALEAQDAAGRVLRERYGNGVRQVYERDLLGQPTRLRVERADGGALLDAGIAHNAYGAITAVTDHDGVGVDQTASFGYDTGARLVSAVIGTAPAAYDFGYQYDALQNMVARSVDGPTAVAVLAGTYRYGEPGSDGRPRGPRQLTSVVAPGGAVTAFDYDPAGRMIRRGAQTMAYSDFDELIAVQGVAPGAATLSYAYGHDGLRVSSVAPDGQETVRFSPSISERPDGTRDIDVVVGSRLIARVTRSPDAHGAAAAGRAPAGGPSAAGIVGIGAGVVLVLLLAGSIRTRRRPTRRAWQLARTRVAVVALLGCACHATSSVAVSAATRTTSETRYYHGAIAAGPTLITRDDGSVVDERRYEPFGAGIGPIDFAVDPHNGLNQLSDPTTGWSDHGVRWLAPEIARWLTPDPPVKAPDPAFMSAPWALHPYQYVDQNPMLYWDPDGREPKPAEAPGAEGGTASNDPEGDAIHSFERSVVAPYATNVAVAERFVHGSSTVEAAEAGAKGLHAVLGVYHLYKAFTTDDPDERDTHIGGAYLAGLSLVLPSTVLVTAPLEMIFGEKFPHAIGQSAVEPVLQRVRAQRGIEKAEAGAKQLLELGHECQAEVENVKWDLGRGQRNLERIIGLSPFSTPQRLLFLH